MGGRISPHPWLTLRYTQGFGSEQALNAQSHPDPLLSRESILYEIALKTIINRLSEDKVHQTEEDGPIEFIADGERLRIEEEK